MLLVLDIDYTLANLSHRSHFADQADPDWDSFFDPGLVMDDTPYAEAVAVLPNLLKQSSSVLILSGRPADLRKTTDRWLRLHFSDLVKVPYNLKLQSSYRVPTPKFKVASIKKFKRPDQAVLCLDDEDENLVAFTKEGWIALKTPEAWAVLNHNKGKE